MKKVKAFLIANWYWVLGGLAFFIGIKRLKSVFTKGMEHLDGSYEETLEIQQNAVDQANEVATHGSDIAGFADNAIAIADALHAHLGSSGGVDWDACIALVQELSYAEGAAVYGAFDIRAYSVMGFELWEGNLWEWVITADTWSLNIGSDSPDFVEAFDYLNQNQQGGAE